MILVMQVVLNEVGQDEGHPGLKAVRLLAEVSKSNEYASAAEVVRGWMEDASMSRNETAMVVAATVLCMVEDHETALKACHCGQGLENMAIGVQVLISMNRLDVASAHVSKMSDIDDDATLTQLATAWVGSRQGGRKLQEAYYIYQELGDKFAWTVKLHNGLACCQMQMERWDDAEAELLQALEKNAKDADTLANLALVSIYVGKPAARYIGMLQSVAPHHPMVGRMAKAEEAFDGAHEQTAVAAT